MSRFATDKLRPGIYSAEVSWRGTVTYGDGSVREEAVLDIVCEPAEAQAVLNYLRGNAVIVPQGIETGERLIRLGDDDDDASDGAPPATGA